MSVLRFSFIIPAYNRAWSLADCLDSVLGESGRGAGDVEVVVVDDGSTDATPELLAKYRERGVRVLRLPENRGPAAARNAGMRLARGEYLVFLDSDDRLLPDGLKGIRRRLDATRRRYAGYWFNCLDGASGRPTGAALEDGFEMTYETLLAGRDVRGEFLPVVRRAEFADIGYVEECRGGEDLAWLELLRRHGPFHICMTPVRWYRRDSPDSVLRATGTVCSENMRNMRKRAEVFLERFGEDARRINPVRFREEHYRAAYAAVYLGDFEAARGHLERLKKEGGPRDVRVWTLELCRGLRTRLPQTLLRFFGRVRSWF